MTLSLPIDAKANELLARSPLALLIGMVLDQQVPLEKAFSSPYDLVLRLGHEADAAELAGYDPEALVEIFAQRPALHRFPKAMGRPGYRRRARSSPTGTRGIRPCCGRRPRTGGTC